MTKRGLNLGKYRVGSGRVDRVDRSVGRSDRSRRFVVVVVARAPLVPSRSVRWSRSVVSCRSFARQCSDGRETTNRATARGAETGLLPGRRRTVGPSDRASSFGTRTRRQRFAFGLDSFIHLDWIIHSGESAFVRSSSSSSSRPNTRRAIDRLRRASRSSSSSSSGEGSIGDHRG